MSTSHAFEKGSVTLIQYKLMPFVILSSQDHKMPHTGHDKILTGRWNSRFIPRLQPRPNLAAWDDARHTLYTLCYLVSTLIYGKPIYTCLR